MRSFLEKSCLAIVASVVVAGCGGGVIDSTEEATQALTRVQDRLPTSGAALQSQNEAFVITAGGVQATLPATGAGTVQVEIEGYVRGVSIVGASAGASRPVQFNANTVLYPQTDRSVSTAFTVAPLDDETVIESYSILHDAQAPEVNRFALTLAPGETLRSTSDTTAQVVDEGSNTTTAIDASWAVDANGQAVPFSLAVDGNQIVMTVRHHEGHFAYPIVADPAIRLTCGIVTCSLYFSRSLTCRMSTPGGVLWAISNFCGYVPVPPLRLACYALGATTGILAVKSAECCGKHQCLRIRFLKFYPHTPVGLYCDGSRYCSNR